MTFYLALLVLDGPFTAGPRLPVLTRMLHNPIYESNGLFLSSLHGILETIEAKRGGSIAHRVKSHYNIICNFEHGSLAL